MGAACCGSNVNMYRVKYGDQNIDSLFPEARDNGIANITLFVGTWNMGNTMPFEDNLPKFLEPNKADIYLIGTQECYPEPEKKKWIGRVHWFEMIARTLGDQYVIVKTCDMYDEKVIIMARKTIARLICWIDVDKEATGFCGISPNKGACAVAFSVCSTSFCFISSHLAAHQGNVKDRESNFKEIIRNITLGLPGKPLTCQFTHVIWVGDLNYRIDQFHPAEAVNLINASEWSSLYEHDQLNKERSQGNVFYEFNEGEITFPPTYKHPEGIEGMPERDGRRPYKTELKGGKLRCPSWTDRIQWKSAPNAKLELLTDSYKSCPELYTSDHSPVRAQFSCNLILPYKQRPCVEGSIQIEISNLKGHNLKAMDFSVTGPGTSDPYCKFQSTIARKATSTEVVSRCLNPKWKGVYTLLGCKGLATGEWVERHVTVLVTAFDRDTLKHDDCIGFGVIACTGGLNKMGAEFTTSLSLEGQPAGTLSGNIKIISLPDPQEDDSFYGQSSIIHEPSTHVMQVPRHDSYSPVLCCFEERDVLEADRK